MQYIIDKSNIVTYLQGGAINTAQGKLLGYHSFSAIPKGWKKRRYILSDSDLKLFIKLNGARNIKAQYSIIQQHKHI